jgi:surfeit locus 1 family protein
MPAGYSFRPRPWAAAAAAAACAAGIALGNWQAGRAAEKRALGAALERSLQSPPIELPAAPVPADQLTWKHVAARGQFVEAHTIYLDNKLRRGRPGYEVVTPLRLDGTHVLVNRGWVAAGRSRDELPRVPTLQGEVRVTGLALPRIPRALDAGTSAPGKVRQNLSLEEFQKETGLQLAPVVIEQHSSTPDGLVREWPRLDSGAQKNQSYAFQWYSLAGLAVVLFAVLSFRRVGAP